MMLQAVEVEVGENGQVTLQEPLVVRGRQRAVLMVLGPMETQRADAATGNVAQSLAVLAAFESLERPDRSPEEMEKTIQENRDGWDD